MFGKKTKQKKKKNMAKALRNMIVRVALIVLIVSTLMSWLFMNLEFSLILELNGESTVTGEKALLEQEGHFTEYAESVMETYLSIPEEIRQNPHSDEYREYFAKYRNSDYVRVISELLLTIDNSMNLQNLYIVVLDPQKERLIYLIDISEQDIYNLHDIGEWVDVPQEMKDSSFTESLLSFQVREDDSEDNDDVIPTFITFESRSEKAGKLLTVGLDAWECSEESEILILCAMPLVLSKITITIFIVIYFVILFIAILLIVIVTRIRLRKRVIRPINSISQAVEDYARQRTEGNTSTSCFSSLSINTNDELQDLAGTLAQMENDLNSYEKDLKEAVSREERVKTELSVATLIQANMLPDAKAIFPDRKDFIVSASMTPAREVGGDFYDFFLIDDSHLGLVIADVSGKGIPAALFMMASMIVIHNFASLGLPPTEVLERSNNRICSSNKLDMFVTVWFGILDLKTGLVTSANAGHEYPALCGADGHFELLKDPHGLVIGGMDGVHYKEYTFTMEKGGILYLYTDGVPEATNAAEEIYGTDRMLQALNSAEDKSPAGLDRALRADIDRFIAGAPQFDDLTTLCIQYLPDDQ